MHCLGVPLFIHSIEQCIFPKVLQCSENDFPLLGDTVTYYNLGLMEFGNRCVGWKAGIQMFRCKTFFQKRILKQKPSNWNELFERKRCECSLCQNIEEFGLSLRSPLRDQHQPIGFGDRTH